MQFLLYKLILKECNEDNHVDNIHEDVDYKKMSVNLLLIRYWQEAQTLCRVVSQRLADAQSQSESVEVKYSKAKRLVRECHSRYLSTPDN